METIVHGSSGELILLMTALSFLLSAPYDLPLYSPANTLAARKLEPYFEHLQCALHLNHAAEAAGHAFLNSFKPLAERQANLPAADKWAYENSHGSEGHNGEKHGF